MSPACRFNFRISPGAKQNIISGCRDGLIMVKIKASPVEGKANIELVNYLSSRLGIPKSSIELVRGFSSRTKVVEINGLSSEQVMGRLGLAE